MMSSFGIVESSSVEALAFNYLRYGLFVLVNNLWTLVAVVTAAVSFWRFNIIPSLSRRHLLLKSSSTLTLAAAVDESQLQPKDSETQQKLILPAVQVAVSCSTAGDKDGGVVVKGNRVYSHFCYDEVILGDEKETEDGRMHEYDDETQRFDVLERLRLSDIGFYEYQDMGVFDGNVVKLWDKNTSCRILRSNRDDDRRTNVVRLLC